VSNGTTNSLEINDLDIVRLHDGREGTVVHVYCKRPDKEQGYEIELPMDGGMVTIRQSGIAEVIYRFVHKQ